MTVAAAGAELRARRLALGLSVDDVAEETRIPVSHIEAIERGDLDALPPPPYRQGYVRAVFEHLDVAVSDAVLAAAGPGPEGPSRAAVPLWVPRAMAASLCVTLLAVLGWAALPRSGPSSGEPPAPQVPIPDQVVQVDALRTAAFRVVVDGEVALDRKLSGGESIELAGHEQVEVHLLEGAETARVRYNGEVVTPQGRQDVPRKLVFIDDLHVTTGTAPGAAQDGGAVVDPTSTERSGPEE